ncbi:hypothetical protein TIFTF001_027514 [Ficus carica]|uniref:Uncharacterized protein n=1 Tax=Ficus carica TaxID=3494 RepID=A0AA88DPD8_FICCA|nr:hypothetical protein TIFTF001_027514 [Ficus carica]
MTSKTHSSDSELQAAIIGSDKNYSLSINLPDPVLCTEPLLMKEQPAIVTIGVPLKPDKNTAEGNYGHYARLLVDDLSKAVGVHHPGGKKRQALFLLQ